MSSCHAFTEQHEFISIKEGGRERDCFTASNEYVTNLKQKIPIAQISDIAQMMSTVIIKMLEMYGRLSFEQKNTTFIY